MNNEERAILCIISTYLSTKDPKGMIEAAEDLKEVSKGLNLDFIKAIEEIIESTQTVLDENDSADETEQIATETEKMKEEIKQLKSQLNYLKASHTRFGG